MRLSKLSARATNGARCSMPMARRCAKATNGRMMGAGEEEEEEEEEEERNPPQDKPEAFAFACALKPR